MNKCYIGIEGGLFRVDMSSDTARVQLNATGFVHVPEQEPEQVTFGTLTVSTLENPASFWLSAHQVNSVIDA